MCQKMLKQCVLCSTIYLVIFPTEDLFYTYFGPVLVRIKTCPDVSDKIEMLSSPFVTKVYFCLPLALQCGYETCPTMT